MSPLHEKQPSVTLLPLRPIDIVSSLVKREAGLHHVLVDEPHHPDLQVDEGLENKIEVCSY